MRNIANVSIAAGGIILIVAIISRFTMTPVTIIPGGLQAQALVTISNTCFLIAITILLLELSKNK